jgi:plastocyanin
MRRSIAALCVAALAAACFSERATIASPDALCTVPADVFGRDRAFVIIRDFAFFPDTISVAPGTTVTWINCEPPASEAHTTTSDTDVWSSGPLVRTDVFSHRFDEPGDFPYFCVPHPFMRGEVVVE